MNCQLINAEWKNVDEMTEQEIYDLAKERGIETERQVSRQVSEFSARNGREVNRTINERIKRTRYAIEDDLRAAMTIEVRIPRELWTDRQKAIYDERGIEDLHDGQKEANSLSAIGVRLMFAGSPISVTEEVKKFIDSNINFKMVKTQERKVNPNNGSVEQIAKWDKIERKRIIPVEKFEKEQAEKFECQYCGRKSTAMVGNSAHERACKLNPANQEKVNGAKANSNK